MSTINFICGACAGWTMVAVGQPFDYIKVKIQTSKVPPTSEWQVAKDIYKTLGLKGFYRGSSSMIFGYTFVGGTEFMVY
jgi:hypothetical protein